MKNGRKLARLDGHKRRVHSLVFLKAGSNFHQGILASASDDGQILLWDLVTGANWEPVENQMPHCQRMSISPDNRQIVAVGKDGLNQIWSHPDNKPLEPNLQWTLLPQRNKTHYSSIASSPDSRFLRVGTVSDKNNESGVVQFWELDETSPKMVREQRKNAPTALAFSPASEEFAAGVSCSRNGDIIAVGQQEGVINLHDSRTGRHLQTIVVDKKLVTLLAFSPDGTRLVAGGGNSLEFLNVATGERLGSLPMPPNADLAQKLTISPDGSFLAAILTFDDKENQIIIWRVGGGENRT
jgi:WD40 repeat protein